MITAIFSLIIIAMLGYFLSNQLFTSATHFMLKKKSSNLSQTNVSFNKKAVEHNRATALLNYFNMNYILREAEKCGARFTKTNYLMLFLIGTAIGVGAILIYFAPFSYLLPIALLGGVLIVNMRLHGIREKYKEELNDQIIIYMSAFSATYGSLRNMGEALMAIIPTIPEPLRKDLDETLVKLQNGKNVQFSFKHVNQRFPHKYVYLFHEQLDVLDRNGDGNVETLHKIAKKMRNRRIYQKQLLAAHKQNFGTWKAFVGMSLSAPFIFLFTSTDNYALIMHNSVTSIAYLITFSFIFFTYYKMERLKVYDPTSEEV